MNYLYNEACLGVLPGTFIACGEFGYCSNECLVQGAYRDGAAVVFGIIGMFEAIRRRRVDIAEMGSDYELGYWVGWQDAKTEIFEDDVIRGDDAKRILDDLENVCSPEEMEKRIAAARRFLELVTPR